MTENKKKLLEFISQNEKAMKRFNELEGLGKEEIIEKSILLAKEYGFEITKEDLAIDADNAQQSRKVSDEELEGISGGVTCACVAGGGGDGRPNPCICIVTGLGYDKNTEERLCFCFLGGGGKGNVG